jgi:hypothetical protein
MSICIAVPGGWGLTELSLHVNDGSAFLLFFFGLPTAAGASFACPICCEVAHGLHFLIWYVVICRSLRKLLEFIIAACLGEVVAWRRNRSVPNLRYQVLVYPIVTLLRHYCDGTVVCCTCS